MQHVDRIAHVETLALPARHRRARVQSKSVVLIPRSDDGHRIRRQIDGPRHLRNDPAVGVLELQLAVRLAFDLVALLVDRAMVSPTEHREVRECRGAALRPVTDVVSLTEPHATAREATALVAVMERAA